MRDFLKNLGLDLLAIIWPSVCVGCERADRELCDDCERGLYAHPTIPITPPVSQVGLWLAASEYEDVYKSMIVGFKHGGIFRFKKPLGKLLAGSIYEILKGAKPEEISKTVFVTMPSRRKKVRERGFDHLEVILRHALKELGISKTRHVAGALKPTRGRTGQVGLNINERQINASRIKVAARKESMLQDSRIILIDDIVTTGASLTAAAEKLKLAGAEIQGAAVISFAIKRIEKARHNMSASD